MVDQRRNTPIQAMSPYEELMTVRARLDVCQQERHEIEIELLNLKRNYIKAKNELKRAREDP